MKRVLAWLLLLALVMGTFAGCTEKTSAPTEATQSTTESVTEDQAYTGPGAQDAIEYLESLYQNDGATIGADYSRYSTIRVGGQAFEVVWTVSLSEDQIKIVDNGDGTCTIDINEENEVETPYVLTATITDPNGESASASWNYILPKGISAEEILKAAYALKDGEVLPKQATLRGTVKSVDELYDPDYKNLTCTIVVEGFEQYPIKCYRLKGEAAEKTTAGNIITVTGTIKNYKGTIEFDSGCIIDKWEEGTPIIMPTDDKEIVDMAWKLARGESLPTAVTLTGIITSIDSKYDPGYGNITVTIAIPGRLNKPIQCYRMKGEDLDKLKTSDLITVSGTIINYKGTREFNAGCKLIKNVPGCGHVQPKDPVDVVKQAYDLPLAGNLLYEAELTGKITRVNQGYDPNYGNATVTFEVEGTEGMNMPIQCYRMTGDASKLAKLKKGDTITVLGLIKKYYSFKYDDWTVQYDKPVLVGYEPGDGSEIVNSAMKPISGVEPGKAYKFGFRQNGVAGKPFCMITGVMAGNYGDTVTDIAQAVDTYVEVAPNGGYYIYTQKNETAAKKYINIAVNGTYYNVSFGSERSNVWYLNEDFDYVWTTCSDGTDVYLGSYGTHTTLSASKTSYIADTSKIGKSQFCAWFLEFDPDGVMEDVGGKVEADFVEAPQAETAYKLGLQQNGVDGQVYYFTGEESGNYLATSTDVSRAADVYMETATGGYKLYVKNGATKKYITIEKSISSSNGKTYYNPRVRTASEMTPSVWDLNKTYKYMTTTHEDGTEVVMGTYGTYTTISCSNSSFVSNPAVIGASQFCAWFIEGGSTSAGGGDYVAAPVAGTAYKMGMDKGDGSVLYFNGQTESASVTYRLATTTNIEEAADVYLETATGGYRLYFMNGGTKTYIRVYHRNYDDYGNGKGSLEFVTTAPSEVFTYNTDANTLFYDYDGKDAYYMGTYSTYTTVSVSNTSYITGSKADSIDVSQFPVRFYATEGDNTGAQPVDPVQVVKEAYALTSGTALPYEAELTGKITKVNQAYSPQYGNITVTFVVEGAEDMPIQCYRMTGDGSKLAKLKPGDTITVKGKIVNYYSATTDTSTIQYDKPEMVDCIFNTGDDTTGNTAMKPCSNIKPGVAYKFGFQQNAITDKPFQMITGGMTGYYGETVTDAAQAVDTYVEAANGGYYIYTLKGSTKNYINITVSGTYYNISFNATASSVWQLNEQYQYVWTTCSDGTDVYLGTYGQNTTLGASKTSYISDTSKIGVSQFCAWFLEVDPDGTGSGGNGGTVTPPATGEVTLVDQPTIGTAYKFGLTQGNVDNKKYFITGEMNGYYMDTTEDATAAADVYLESATGGYYLYTTAGGKQYINMVVSGTHVNAAFENTATTVYTYDSAKRTVVATVNDTLYMHGTRNDKTYTTAGPVKVELDGFQCQFYTLVEGSGSDTPSGGAGFVADPKAETAYKFGLQQNGIDGAFYYFTGEESGNYLATSTDASKAADVYMETATGGVKLYVLKGGVKTYITIEKTVNSSNGKTYYNPKLRTPAEADIAVWKLNTAHKYITTTHSDGTEVVMGTYGTYSTISCSKSSFISDPSVIGVTQFCCWFLEANGTGGGTVTPPAGGEAGFVADPKAETAYKLGLQQNGADGKIYYFTGEESGNYLATSSNSSEAVDVYMETATGGFKLYVLKGGVKNYITIEKNISSSNGKTYYNPRVRPAAEMTPSVWVLNKDHKYITTTHEDGTEVVMGTYNTYTTISCSKSSFISDTSVIGVTQFCAWFLDSTGSGTGGGTVTPPVTGGEYVTAPVAGTAYKLGMDKGDGSVLYFNGQTESATVTYRLAVTTNVAEAVDVYLEAATGGYRLYFMNGGTKTYIRVFHRSYDDYGNGKGSLEFVTDAPSEVFTYNTDANTLVYDYDGKDAYYMGTYSTYTTVSVSNTSYITGSKADSIDVSQFPARFYTSDGTGGGTGGGTTPTPTPTPEPEPVTGTKYTFANYTKGTSDYVGSEVHKLDDNVTVTVYNKAWFNTQLRLYDYTSTDYTDAYATLQFSKPATKLVLNAGYKVATLKIWVSNDGATWTALSDVATATAYADYTIDLGGAYTYVKLQAAPQVRIIYFVVRFEED